MQIYSVRMFNFFRFGEKNNSIVFDISPEDNTLIETGKLTLDGLYDAFKANPRPYIEASKKRGLSGLIGISGIIGEDYDKSNGVGKSTTLEAICYAIYDQIVRKNVNTEKVASAGKSVVTRINNEIPNSVKESYVELIFEEKGEIYRIKRGREFSKSKITDKPVLEFKRVTEKGEESYSGHRTTDTNEAIASVVNRDYDLFVNSVMFGQQDSGKFLVGTDKTRKDMLLALLRLEMVIVGCLEKIRERLSVKREAIKTISAQKNLIEEDLSKSKTVEQFEGDIEAETKKIADSEQQIQKITSELEALQKSEALTTVSKFREEKAKVRGEIKSKESERDSQIEEWKKLHSQTSIVYNDNVLKTDSLNNKIAELISQIEKKNTEISSFDTDKCEEILKKSVKAKELKPQYETKLNEIQSSKESLISKMTLVKADEQRANTEIKSLNAQLKASGNKDEFLCDKCKSMVSRKHLEQEISKNEEIVKAKGIELQTLKVSQDAIESALADTKSKMETIANLIAQEPKVKFAISGHEQNQVRVKELSATKEEQEKSKVFLLEQTETLNKQREEYKNKAVDIRDKYVVILKAMEDSIVEIDKKASGIEAEVQKITNQINEFKQQKASLSSAINGSSSRIGSIKKEIEHIKSNKSKLAELATKLQAEEVILGRLLFLENLYGLEGIQTRIIKRYLKTLNDSIKEFLDVLSKGEMKVEVFINDTSKVDIKITGGSAGVFHMLSGGEKMLVRLSVSIGLSMLSFTRSAQTLNFIALDEIFGCLDESHVHSVFKLLAKLQSKFERILVISHNANVNDLIRDQILIEKQVGNNGYSSIKKIGIIPKRIK